MIYIMKPLKQLKEDTAVRNIVRNMFLTFACILLYCTQFFYTPRVVFTRFLTPLRCLVANLEVKFQKLFSMRTFFNAVS